jgi:hypothetical protein
MTTSDLQLIQALLGGSIEHDARGRLRLVYLDEGSAEELSARRALARILRGDASLNHQIRSKLAELFDPDVTWLEERKISFSFRKSNRPTDHAAAAHVFVLVNDRIKKPGATTLERAIGAVAQELGISDEMVKKCWGRFSRLFGVKAPRRRHHSEGN